MSGAILTLPQFLEIRRLSEPGFTGELDQLEPKNLALAFTYETWLGVERDLADEPAVRRGRFEVHEPSGDRNPA